MNQRVRVAVLASLFVVCQSVAAEEIKIRVCGQTVTGEVVSVTDKAVTIKVQGKEQVLNSSLVEPKSLYLCRKALADPKDAKAAFELGQFCLSKNLKEDAQFELHAAKRLDPVGYTEKVDQLLAGGAQPAPKPTPEPAPPVKDTKEPAKTPDKPKPPDVNPKPLPDPILKPPDKIPTPAPDKPEPPKKPCSKCRTTGFMSCSKCRAAKDFWCSECEKGKTACETCKGSGYLPCEKCGQGGNYDESVKKLLEIRQKQMEKVKKLEEVCGIKDMITLETAHYRVYADMDHKMAHTVAEWNEHLYKTLASILDHKEEDRLWNGKCDIYYFDTRQKFQEFAAKVDGSAMGVNSGGYFSHRGRDVHIAIPFYDRMSTKTKDREAHNTLFHEGTHAFLQLTGETVRVMPWLHEGLAQYLEFFGDNLVYCGGDPTKKHLTTGFQRNMSRLREDLLHGNTKGFEDMMKASVISPMDPGSYAYAWSMVLFLVKVHPTKFIKMVKLIKERESKMMRPEFPGEELAFKTHKEALEEAFGHDLKKIEEAWLNWLKVAAKNSFKD